MARGEVENLKQNNSKIMEKYRDFDNDSNIVEYEIGSDFIIVEFKSGDFKFYKYTTSSTSPYNVSEMQRLAYLGGGLNAFIDKHKPKYESKRR